jgi:hypothetical protein
MDLHHFVFKGAVFMSVKFSLLRKVALSASMFGVVATSHAFLGTVYATHPSGAAGVPALSGNHFYGNLDVDMNFGSSTFNVSGMGFFRWLQSSGSYNARGKGYAATYNGGDTNTNAFYTLCAQFNGIVTPAGFDAYDTLGYGGGIERAGNIVAYNMGGQTAFKHALTSENRYRAAGLQLAVWASIYGGGAAFVNNGDGATVGTFNMVNNDAADSANLTTVVSFAEAYYNQAINASGYNAIYLDGRDVNGDDEGQGQITVDVPEPFTMGLGIAGMAAYIRRRMKTKRA